MTEPITLAAEGYDELAIILRDAFLQASEGKGAERHANSKPFHEQPMQTISDLFDSDKGMAFQIVKKLREGLDMPEYERLERELLGVIVYTAGAILWHKRRRGESEREAAERARISQQCATLATMAENALSNATQAFNATTPVCPGCGREEGKKCRRGCPTLTPQPEVPEDPFAGAPGVGEVQSAE